jgi:ubiquinone/menaquinone biosynthesis C-methylase UbiE
MYSYEDIFTSTPQYESRFSGETGKWFIHVQNETILKCIGDLNTASVLLDVGGGHGQLREATEKLGMRYLVLASHSDAFGHLRQRAGNRAQEAEKGLVSDLLNLALKDKSIAVVSCVRLVSHIDQWKRLIAEICRVSSEKVIIDYPPLVSSNIFYKIMFPLKKLLEGSTRTFTIFSHTEIEKVFEEQGFKLKEKAGQFFWPMVLHRKLKSVAISRILEAIAKVFGLVRLLGNPTIAVFERVQR